MDWILCDETKYRVRDAAGRRVAEGRTKREAVLRALAAAKRQGVAVRIVDGDCVRASGITKIEAENGAGKGSAD